jgi:hypothetical protein
MKIRQLFVLTALLTAGGLCSAQTGKPAITEDFRPSTLNQPGQNILRSTHRVMQDSGLKHLMPKVLL